MTPSNKTTRTSTQRLKAAGAFTLIELLVVIFILGILVTLVVGVATYVYDEAGRKQTQATQAIVMSAIEAFYAEFDKYPPDRKPPVTGQYLEDESGKILLRYLTGAIADADDYEYVMESAPSAPGDFDELNRRIQRVTLDALLKLPSDAYSPGDSAVKDGFGNAMRYEREGGLAGRPVLISPGPDENFDTEDDNIRSDEY